jgi:hypothetical protein
MESKDEAEGGETVIIYNFFFKLFSLFHFSREEEEEEEEGRLWFALGGVDSVDPR